MGLEPTGPLGSGPDASGGIWRTGVLRAGESSREGRAPSWLLSGGAVQCGDGLGARRWQGQGQGRVPSIVAGNRRPPMSGLPTAPAAHPC